MQVSSKIGFCGIVACGWLVVACGSASSFGVEPVPTRDGGLDASFEAALEAGANDAAIPKSDPDPELPTAPSRLVLFGGFVNVAGGALLRDTWEWDGSSWAKRASTGPSGRTIAALAALNGKAILFGGYDGTALGDTWEWNGSSWNALSASGPSARYSAAFTSVGGKIVLFGGIDAKGTALGDTWEWDGTAWSKKMVTGPSARGGAAMTAVGGKAVLFGGAESDTWEWDGAAWRELAKTSTLWRSNHSMATLGGKALVIGGSAGGCPSDVREWDGLWNLKGGLAIARCGATSATFGAYVLLFGGSGYPDGLGAGHKYMDETWTWDGAAWTQREVAGPPPRDRSMMVTY